MTAYKHTGVSVPVRLVDGVPQCAHCKMPMVQPDPEHPELWQCPLFADMERRFTEALARYVEKIGSVG